MAEGSPRHDNRSTPTAPPQDPTQNPSSPYYLHPGENPGTVLVAPPLNDTYYYNWSKAMCRALSSKKKLKFINGELPHPLENDPLAEAWENCNDIAFPGSLARSRRRFNRALSRLIVHTNFGWT